MIHHISIGVKNPLQVAGVLAEILNGKVYTLLPYPDCYIVCPFDEHGSAIQLYPLGMEIVPGAESSSHSFVQSPGKHSFSAVHAAISVPTSQKGIEEIGDREEWRTVVCNSAPFRVVEFWVENSIMLEFLPPELADEYINFMQPQTVEKSLGQPIFVPASV